MRLFFIIQLLACLLVNAPSSAQHEFVWDGLPDAQFSIGIYGRFSNQASWNVNLYNAPVGLKRPKDLDFDPTLIEILNDSLPSVVHEILTAHQMQSSWKESDYKKWKRQSIRLFEPDSDRYFRVELLIDGDNGVGGHFGGLDMRLYFRSLHRQWDVVFGYSFRTLDDLGTPAQSLISLSKHLETMLAEAIRDWKASLQKDLQYPVRYLFVQFDTEGLNRRQRAFVRKTLFPCLYQQTDSLGYVRLNDYEYQVFYRLGKRSDTGTEEGYLRWYSDVLLFAMGTSDKYACSLYRTPLANFRADIERMVTDKKLIIRWNKPE